MGLILKTNSLKSTKNTTDSNIKRIKTSIDGYTVILDISTPEDEVELVEPKGFKKFIYEYVDRINRCAYNALASEYDDVRHTRTWLSIKASEEGFNQLSKFIELKNEFPSLEVGCGTGQLTKIILKNFNIDKFVAIDISNKMIDICNNKKNKGEFINDVTFKIMSILNPSNKFLKNQFEFIACGLADPYFLPKSVEHMSKLLVTSGMLFISIPGINYAEKERSERINADIYMTKYKLENINKSVECFSFVYTLNALKHLLINYEFDIKHILEVTPRMDNDSILADDINKNPPKVICILANKK